MAIDAVLVSLMVAVLVGVAVAASLLVGFMLGAVGQHYAYKLTYRAQAETTAAMRELGGAMREHAIAADDLAERIVDSNNELRRAFTDADPDGD